MFWDIWTDFLPLLLFEYQCYGSITRYCHYKDFTLSARESTVASNVGLRAEKVNVNHAQQA